MTTKVIKIKLQSDWVLCYPVAQIESFAYLDDGPLEIDITLETGKQIRLVDTSTERDHDPCKVWFIDDLHTVLDQLMNADW